MKDEKYIPFLKAALKFICRIWDDEKIKCNQKNIALRLGYTSSYLSKAKENPSYARNISRKVLRLIKELGGEYSAAEETFYDKDKKPFPIELGIESGFTLEIQEGVDSPIFRSHMEKTKSIRILTTWAGETYENLMKILDDKPEVWKSIEKIEVLVLHPNSMATYLRSKGLGYNHEKGFNRIKDELQEIMNSPLEVKNKLEIRLYDELPSLKLLIMDSLTTIGFFLYKELSRKGNHIILEHEHNPAFALSLKRHFYKIWNGAEVFDFDQGEDLIESWKYSVYKKHNKAVYEKFEGTYRLYYSERYSSQKEYQNHKIAASIGCNILEIKNNGKGVFKCRMNAMGSEEGEYYEGEILNTGFNNPKYLIIQLKNKYDSRYLNLSFSIKNKRKGELRFGVFSVIYGFTGALGSGLTVLRPVESKFDDLKPESLNPRTLNCNKENEHSEILDHQVISYLAHKKESLVFPVSKKEDLQEALIQNGTYKLYSYGQKSEDKNIKQITIAIIEVLSSGMVRFKNRPSRFEGVGWARKIQSNLYIELVNSKQNINRTALFILHVGKNPSPNKESIIYCGISAGTTWQEENPVASRVIMEYYPNKSFECLKSEKIAIHSNNIAKIPLAIRKVLLGKSSNFIGFFNKRRRIFSQATLEEYSNYRTDYSILFFKGACFDALEGDYESSRLNLEKALKHGFVDIPKFKEFLKKNNIQSDELEKIIIQIEQFLRKMKEM